MTNYETELLEKKFQVNIVIRFLGEYFAIRQPDTGLTIDDDKVGVIAGLTVNPTTIDLKRVSSTIASYGIKLIDKNLVITRLVKDNATALLQEEVEVWVGRSTGSFTFSDYFKLPITRIKKVDHIENAYNISASESTDKMNMPFFDLATTLNVTLAAGGATATVENTTGFPNSGILKIEDEFITYSGKTATTFTGLSRGAKSSVDEEHTLGNVVYNVVDVTENPLTLFLQLLISGGGGGTYDALSDGLAIDESLIDVSAIETIRDSIFSGEQFSFSLYNIPNALRFIENEILLACNLRLTVSSNSKLSVALLDQSVFSDADNTIDEDSITNYPQWSVDENRIVNSIEIAWDFDEGTQLFKKRSVYTDQDSIDEFGQRTTYKLELKGIKASLDGQSIVDDRADRFLERFSTPTPEISINTHISQHLYNVGDKILLNSSQIPTSVGDLNFLTDLEILSRSINFVTGDVKFKLAFTSYSGIRKCYIAPSDVITTVVSQNTFTVPAGRGATYKAGWKMRLWDIGAMDYAPDAVNEIESITDDIITMVDDWATTLTPNDFRLKFADYDDTADSQRVFCFISDDGNDFADATSTYRITF